MHGFQIVFHRLRASVISLPLLFFLSLKFGPIPRRGVSLSFVLDLHSRGTVNLVQSRQCARSRRHRRADHRSGKDHTLPLQSRHERFQARLPLLARLVVSVPGIHGDPNLDCGRTRSNDLPNARLLLDIVVAYLKAFRMTSKYRID